MRARRQFLVLGTIGAALALVTSCSFSPFPSRKITVTLPPALRDGPALGAMSHYALMVSEGLANSLSRTSSPTSVAQLFSASPSLKAYVLAQGTKNTAGGGTASLAPSYDASSAADVITGCPPAGQNLHAAVTSGVATKITYLKGTVDGVNWTSTPLNNVYPATVTNLEIDTGGAAHIFYSQPNTSSGVRYLQNSSGTFAEIEAISPSVTTSFSQHAVIFDAAGALKLVTNLKVSGSNYHVSVFEKVINAFVNPVDAFTVDGSPFKEMNFALAANGNLLIAGVLQAGSNPTRLAQYASGTWTDSATLTAAGAVNCAATNSPNGVFNSAGYAHVAFVCSASGTTYVSYATNVTGIWRTKNVTAYGAAVRTAPVIAIANGALYLLWGDGSNLSYVVGDAVNGTFSAPSQSIPVAGNITELQMIANSSTDLKAIATVTNGSNTDIVYFAYDGTAWTNRTVMSLVGSARLARGFFQR